MILKFFQHCIRENCDHDEALAILSSDIRVHTLVDWLMARYQNLDFEYKVATTYALGLLCSAYRFELKNPQHYMDVIMALDNIDVPVDKYMELPSLIFMLPSFLNQENAPYVA